MRSAAVGILGPDGVSVHEPRDKMGVSHLLEHMVFKGTERRSAQDIALALESRGGSLDAYTGRDHTAFQARVLDERPARSPSTSSTDLVRRPLLRESDLDLERKVVLEEIAMVEDTPDDLVFDLHDEALWREHPYGYSILGTRETVSALERRPTSRRCTARATIRGNCVVAAAGNVEHEQLLDAARAAQGWFDGASRAPSAPPVGRRPAVGAGERARRARRGRRRTSSSAPTTVPLRRPAPLRAGRSSTTLLGGGMSRAGSSSGCARSWGSPTRSTRSSQLYQSRGRARRVRRHRSRPRPTRRWTRFAASTRPAGAARG